MKCWPKIFQIQEARAEQPREGFTADFTSETWTGEALQVQFTCGTPKAGSSWKEWMALALRLPPCFCFLGKNK